MSHASPHPVTASALTRPHTTPIHLSGDRDNGNGNGNGIPATSATSPNRFFYKLVARVGPRYLSIYDGTTEYPLGEVMRATSPLRVLPALGEPVYVNLVMKSTTAASRHISEDGTTGGFFVYRTAEQALNAPLPDNSALYVAPRVLLKVLAWGECIQYSHDRFCFENIRPVVVVELPLGYLASKCSLRTLTSISLASQRQRQPRFVSPLSVPTLQYRRREHLQDVKHATQKLEHQLTRLVRKPIEKHNREEQAKREQRWREQLEAEEEERRIAQAKEDAKHEYGSGFFERRRAQSA